tara:strand:- start:666 stop:1139 length:474 start_codon:yes stop_codon:yes gene_type:complete
VQTDHSSTLNIPDKLFFRIGEVARITELKPYVLRYWESEFPILKPGKSRTGQRLYKRADLDTVLEIKCLLRDRKFTIKGARAELLRLRRARTQAAEADETVRLGPEVVDEPSVSAADDALPDPELRQRADRQREALSSVRDALQELRSDLQDFRSQF